MEKYISHKWKWQKSGGCNIYISEIDFKGKDIKKDKECYVLVKSSIQEDFTLVNTYACNIWVLKYIKPILICIKGKIDWNTVTLGDF